MPAIAVIPSRYSSTRFPGKALYPLFGKPIIRHVYERTSRASLVERTFVATDDRRIFDAVEGAGGRAIMTSGEHGSGTDRIAEAVLRIQDTGYAIQERDIVVNVQGDEPMIEPGMIDAVIDLMSDERASIGTLAKRITDPHEIVDPNVVKVVFNAEGYALYFSRAPIPYHRDVFQKTEDRKQKTDEESPCSVLCPLGSEFEMYKHVGIYAYRKDVLMTFSKLPPARLEGLEKLEQLRALENGFKIKVGETTFETIGVDTPMDLERVEKCLSLSL